MTGIRTLALLALGSLCACGDGAVDLGDGLDGPTTFVDLEQEAGLLLASSLAAGSTAPADLPVTGSATYEGVMGLGGAPAAVTPEAILADPEALGALTLEADFGGGSLSGRAGNFRTSDGGTLDGSLAITDGTIENDGQAGFRADVSGALTDDGGLTRYDGEVVGAFFGDGADSVVGTAVLVATPEDGTPEIARGAIVAD